MEIFNVIKRELVDGSKDECVSSEIVATFNTKELATIFADVCEKLKQNAWCDFKVERADVSKSFIHITDIEWDVDDEDEEDEITLPTELAVPYVDFGCPSVDEGDISEYLSDTYGYCHKGFHYEVI